MVIWVTIKKIKKKKNLKKRGKKRLNEILKYHMAGPHALSHEIWGMGDIMEINAESKVV